MPRNQKGDGKIKGQNGRPKHGCPRCGSQRNSSGKWCLCNGFRANGTCFKCGKKRIGGFKKPNHPTKSVLFSNGTRWPVSACKKVKRPIGPKDNNNNKKGKKKKERTKVTQSKTKGQDLGGTQWCLPVGTDCDGSCCICGCSRHVDEFGDRICWCDACDQSVDWMLEWKPCWRRMEDHGNWDEWGENVCCYCGCSRHVDEVGDRVCWCDACKRFASDWENTWKITWRSMKDTPWEESEEAGRA